MKKVNVDDKVKQFNLCRLKYEHKAFLYADLFKALKEFKINSNIVCQLLKHGCFDKEVINGRNIYSFQKDPLHKSIMERALGEIRDQNKKWRTKKAEAKVATKQPTVGEATSMFDDAIKLLSNSDDYVVQKKVFDLEKFKKEQPVMYQKYLKFEIV